MRINMKPSKVWDYYDRYKGSLAFDTVAVMSDDDGNISVHITDEDDELGIYVMVNGIIAYDRVAWNRESCDEIMGEVIDRYFPSEDTESESEDSDLDEFIEENEKNLDDIVSDLVSALIDDVTDEHDFDDICADVKDLVCEHLAYELGVRVYRPMVLEDEDGEDFYTANPYEYLED